MICVQNVPFKEYFDAFQSNGSIVACKFKLNRSSSLVFYCYIPIGSDYAFEDFADLANKLTTARKMVKTCI